MASVAKALSANYGFNLVFQCFFLYYHYFCFKFIFSRHSILVINHYRRIYFWFYFRDDMANVFSTAARTGTGLDFFDGFPDDGADLGNAFLAFWLPGVRIFSYLDMVCPAAFGAFSFCRDRHCVAAANFVFGN